MTIGIQNAINAEHPRPRAIPDEGSIEVSIHISEEVESRMAQYLDAHPGMSWDTVAEMALENFLTTTV